MRRRATLLAAAGIVLSGCGFRPIYGSHEGEGAGPAEQGLSEISVALIPERTGQLLRQALQTRLDRAGAGAAKRYDLVVSLGFLADALDIQQLTSIPSRYRLVAVANWSLVAQDVQRRTLTSGMARVMDGLNLYNQQYFAMDMEMESVQRRMMLAVADQMTLQLASWFNRHAAAG
jgi:LPS-assembly lipoprotein